MTPPRAGDRSRGRKSSPGSEELRGLRFPLLLARGQVAQAIEHDLAELAAHGREMVRHGRHSQIQRRRDRRVGGPRLALVGEVVSSEYLEHVRSAEGFGMALEVRDRA